MFSFDLWLQNNLFTSIEECKGELLWRFEWRCRCHVICWCRVLFAELDSSRLESWRNSDIEIRVATFLSGRKRKGTVMSLYTKRLSALNEQNEHIIEKIWNFSAYLHIQCTIKHHLKTQYSLFFANRNYQKFSSSTYSKNFEILVH